MQLDSQVNLEGGLTPSVHRARHSCEFEGHRLTLLMFNATLWAPASHPGNGLMFFPENLSPALGIEPKTQRIERGVGGTPGICGPRFDLALRTQRIWTQQPPASTALKVANFRRWVAREASDGERRQSLFPHSKGLGVTA
eukprot:7390702-Prymnesium_polylepis.1